MARPLRVEFEGAVYHVTCRGNNGGNIFFGDEGCEKFLDTLDEACRRAGWLVHAYVLMGNHYHLMLETPEGNLVDGMKWFQGTYTQRINGWQKGRGHLFQGRYKAQLISSEQRDENYFQVVSEAFHGDGEFEAFHGDGEFNPKAERPLTGGEPGRSKGHARTLAKLPKPPPTRPGSSRRSKTQPPPSTAHCHACCGLR